MIPSSSMLCVAAHMHVVVRVSEMLYDSINNPKETTVWSQARYTCGIITAVVDRNI